MDEFVKRLRQPGRFAVIGKGDNWWDVVRVEDVAAAMRRRRRARARPAPSTTWPTTSRSRSTTSSRLTAEALGTGPPRRIPAGWRGWSRAPTPSLAVTRSARSSNARIKRELGWQPR